LIDLNKLSFSHSLSFHIFLINNNKIDELQQLKKKREEEILLRAVIKIQSNFRSYSLYKWFHENKQELTNLKLKLNFCVECDVKFGTKKCYGKREEKNY